MQAYLATHPMVFLVLALLSLVVAVMILDDQGPPPSGTTSSGFLGPRDLVVASIER